MHRLITLALSLIMSLMVLNPGAVFALDQCGEQQITPARLNQILTETASANLLLLDTRSHENFLAGTIPGAISSQKLQDMINGAHQDNQDTTIVVVTRDGRPGGQLQKWIGQLCQKNVAILILQGGVNGWSAQGLALEKPAQRLIAPGEVPFIIPRGLCEMNAPVQKYN